MYYYGYNGGFVPPTFDHAAELVLLTQKLHEALSYEEQGKKKSLQHQLYIQKLEDRIVDIETRFLIYKTSCVV